MDSLRHVKPAVRALSAYTLALREAPVKLNQNENPWDLPEAVRRRVLAKALDRSWSRYPDFDPKDLLEALARFSGWRADGILAGNGSNELIEALLLVTVGPGTKVVIPQPTFTLYALLTTILGGEPVSVPMRCVLRDATDDERARGTLRSPINPAAHALAPVPSPARPTVASPAVAPAFAYDVEALLESLRESQASVVVVCSPNNPTGTSLPLADVERLCEESDSLVVIDEAYHEFSGQSAVPFLGRGNRSRMTGRKVPSAPVSWNDHTYL